MLKAILTFALMGFSFNSAHAATVELDVSSELTRFAPEYLPENSGKSRTNCAMKNSENSNFLAIGQVAAQALTVTNPCKKISHEASGKYSYYGKGDGTQGGKTMCGSKFNTNERTIALPVALVDKPWTDKVEGPVKCDSIVMLTDQKSGKTVYAKVTDTGGFAKYGRVADVSYKVAQELGYANWTNFKKDPPKLSLRVCAAQ